MDVRPLTIEGAWLCAPKIIPDIRGAFLELFKIDTLVAATHRKFDPKQANLSVSRRGTIRGLHFASVPPGQAKYISCVGGSILDVVVDIRVGSPTFGQWESIELDDSDRCAIFIAEGLAHGFCALSDTATVTYLCSEMYAPDREFGIHPLDEELSIRWPQGADVVLSPRDSTSPTLSEASQAGLLPTYEQCQAWYVKLTAESRLEPSDG